MDTREKILSRAGLHEVLEEHRRAGRKIVFAHGVLDLLHVGHVRYLAAARKQGDILVVAIHSDASVKKLKGDGRPILTERARAVLVAALAAVGYVIIFEETNVQSLLHEFQPDVHVGQPAAVSGSAELSSTYSTAALIAHVRRGMNG